MPSSTSTRHCLVVAFGLTIGLSEDRKVVQSLYALLKTLDEQKCWIVCLEPQTSKNLSSQTLENIRSVEVGSGCCVVSLTVFPSTKQKNGKFRRIGLSCIGLGVGESLERCRGWHCHLCLLQQLVVVRPAFCLNDTYDIDHVESACASRDAVEVGRREGDMRKTDM